MPRISRIPHHLQTHGFRVVAGLLLFYGVFFLYTLSGLHEDRMAELRAAQVEECYAQVPRAWCGFGQGMGQAIAHVFAPVIVAALAGLALFLIALERVDGNLQRAQRTRASLWLRTCVGAVVVLASANLAYEELTSRSAACVASDCYVFHAPIDVTLLGFALAAAFLLAGLNLVPWDEWARARTSPGKANPRPQEP